MNQPVRSPFPIILPLHSSASFTLKFLLSSEDQSDAPDADARVQRLDVLPPQSTADPVLQGLDAVTPTSLTESRKPLYDLSGNDHERPTSTTLAGTPAPGTTTTDTVPSPALSSPLPSSTSSPSAVFAPGSEETTTGGALDGAETQQGEEEEEESPEGGAFNPITGEINWDCPCLGGMAHGPCGENFRTAFSCFVFSKEEPKGMDCIEHFKAMQGCFREHPEIYGAELEEEEKERLEFESEREREMEEQERGRRAASTSGGVGEAIAEVELGKEVRKDLLESGAMQEESDGGGKLVPRDTDHSGQADVKGLVTEVSATPTTTTSPAASKSTFKDTPRSPIEQKAQRILDPGEPTAESEGILPKSSHDATDA